MKKEDCKTADTDFNVSMSSESPFTISSKVNVAEGYQISKCVVCSSTSLTKTFVANFKLESKIEEVKQEFVPIHNYNSTKDGEEKEIEIEIKSE